ncbi:uncharacterized protein AKAW2_80766S [Aspergillus luchuensis]|uniref:Altered inheritance of mitochondria protein 9, mitochondrial n=1 Tax=Aspergillus kawachii TaxID=1069201 RepID=A0A7R7WLN1_ASPKA|nr:uncharacterized protein AKAW2_80766S [Aspergillus luchuensis]BCS04965.1 hypothetical protein AKAW2_80766S [Aspergillus luchuensis]
MVHNVDMQPSRLSFFLVTSRTVPRVVRHHFTTYTAICSGTKPVLVRLLEDGSEVHMNNDEIFRYQRYKWLSGDCKHLAARYRDFNLDNLLEAAVQATGRNGTQCVKVLKCLEGQYNKAFVLTMNNGEELVARLPNPNAGPPFYTTASEVATRHFAREVLGIPVPRIYAWSADSSSSIKPNILSRRRPKDIPLGACGAECPGRHNLESLTKLLK